MNPRRVSILHVIDSLQADTGGPSRSVPHQCVSTVAAGMDVGIAFVQRGRMLSDEAARMTGDEIHSFPSARYKASFQLWKHVRDCDIVHVNGIWGWFTHLGCFYARAQRKPLVVTPHGMLEPWALGQKKLKKELAFLLYQKKDLREASVLQATSKMEADHLQALGLRSPIAVIANGMDIPENLKTKRQADGRRRLLFLSRIHPKKGVLELVRAAARLRPILERGSWIVTIAGPDEDGYLETVRKESRKLGLDAYVEFMGPVEGEAKWRLYRSSDLFVLPTYSENFGLVVAEALGCGLPVVTTHGAPWAELEEHRCGWWHPVGQEHLERTLGQALLTPKATLLRMGERGRSLVRKKYAWDRIGLELRGVYLWLLGSGSKPSCILKTMS